MESVKRRSLTQEGIEEVKERRGGGEMKRRERLKNVKRKISAQMEVEDVEERRGGSKKSDCSENGTLPWQITIKCRERRQGEFESR